MLNDEEIKEREDELKEMEKQIEQEAEAKEEKAALVPPPYPDPSPAADAEPSETPVGQEEQDAPSEGQKPDDGQKPKEDPMEWAKAKGFKSPEDMARALLQKEREFHESRQKKKEPPPIPSWQPQPEMGAGYPPPVYPNPVYGPRVDSFRELSAMYPQIDPEDLRRFMPVVVDAAQAIARRERMELERQITGIQRTTERNNELMTLMQDPAFRDNRVQKEIHAIIDADPSIFQRERTPLVHAYEKAMVNLARRTLQQGTNGEVLNPGSTPPVTASGGNGSSFTTPTRITEKIFDSWSLKDQEAYLKSNGKILPKKR